MTWKKRDDNFLLWGVNIILMGMSILIASHSVYKGLDLALLHEEVEELRHELSRLQVKEDMMEEEVKRHKRQVDLFSRPEVLDYAYNSQMPDSSSELSVYDKWFQGVQSEEKRGLSTTEQAPQHKRQLGWGQRWRGGQSAHWRTISARPDQKTQQCPRQLY